MNWEESKDRRQRVSLPQKDHRDLAEWSGGEGLGLVDLLQKAGWSLLRELGSAVLARALSEVAPGVSFLNECKSRVFSSLHPCMLNSESIFLK